MPGELKISVTIQELYPFAITECNSIFGFRKSISHSTGDDLELSLYLPSLLPPPPRPFPQVWSTAIPFLGGGKNISNHDLENWRIGREAQDSEEKAVKPGKARNELGNEKRRGSPSKTSQHVNVFLQMFVCMFDFLQESFYHFPARRWCWGDSSSFNWP